MGPEFDEAIARIPRWILLLAALGTPFAAVYAGLNGAGGYLIGSLAAWVNFRVIERAAGRVARLAREGEKASGGTGAWVFIQFTGLMLGAFAILAISGFSRLAAFCGFLIAPSAVILEVVYELITLRH